MRTSIVTCPGITMTLRLQILPSARLPAQRASVKTEAPATVMETRAACGPLATIVDDARKLPILAVAVNLPPSF